MFFTQPKINSVAERLKSVLTKQCQGYWANYLRLVPSADCIQYDNHLNKEIDIHQIFSTHEMFREKDHFAWHIRILQPNERRLFLEISIAAQYGYFSKLLKKACLIQEELQKKEPDYQLIIDLAKAIQSEPTHNTSLISGLPTHDSAEGGIPLGCASTLNRPILEIFDTLFVTLNSVFLIPFYCLNYSKYCGSLSFFTDAMLRIIDSLLEIVQKSLTNVYSTLTTGTYQPSSQKNDIDSCLESIILLAESYKNIKAQLSDNTYYSISSLD